MSTIQSNELHRMLKRVMRRQGVSFDDTPNMECWLNFLHALDQTISEFEENRKRLERSTEATSIEIKQLYEGLKTESNLRLAQSDAHQRELEKQVNERTSELENARLRLEKINKRLEYDASHDSLTGAKNRSYFMRRLNGRVASAQTDGDVSEKLDALFFIDFDRFKQINDTLGHVVGDKVLIQTANRLASLVRDEDDCLARLGGDEFVLLTRVRDEDAAIEVAQRISNAFAKPIRIRDQEIMIGSSIGIVVAREPYQSADDFVRDADLAMYSAKDGDEKYRLFDEAMRLEHLERMELEQELEIAISESQFIVNYEPIVDVKNGEIYSIESLVRWIHPEKGLISPGKFIPLAEERGLVVDIDRIVFRKTCESFQKWQQANKTFPNQHFNVNLASGQLDRADTVPFLLSTIDTYGIAPHSVILEITESHLLEDSGQVTENLNQLSSIGFKIFVDDFGTGYSSLSYLAKYPIDGIKIDRAFVRDVNQKPQNREIIRSIIAMAEALNVKVVAEGVETINELQLITDLSCHLIQGFLFTRPMNVETATQFLDDRPFLEIIEKARNAQPKLVNAWR